VADGVNTAVVGDDAPMLVGLGALVAERNRLGPGLLLVHAEVLSTNKKMTTPNARPSRMSTASPEQVASAHRMPRIETLHPLAGVIRGVG